MKSRIICVGKIKDFYYRDEIARIQKEIAGRGSSLEIIELPDEKIPERLSERNRDLILKKEGEGFNSRIQNQDYVIALCIEGKEITTKQHKEAVSKAVDRGYTCITYLIGGSLGIAKEWKQKADLRLSFSKMTFPHQLMRMILCEEILHIL